MTSYELVEEVLRNPADFSSFGAEGAYINRLPDDVLESLTTLLHHFRQPGLIHSDGTKHSELRRAVNPPFTKAALTPLTEIVRELVVELLGPARSTGEPFDVVTTLCQPLPVRVIAQVLGVPASGLDRFPVWSLQLARFFTGPEPQPDIARDLDEALVEWRQFVSDLIDARTSSPDEDFVSVVAAAIADGRMTREDGVAIIVHSLQAGHETTTNMIGTTLFLLLSHPDQLALVHSAPEMVEHAVEEALRFEPPALNGRRTTTRDVVLGGIEIPAGTAVVVNLAAANRDEAQYPNPDAFDVSRLTTKADHMGFGRGTHFCLGASLARLELPIAVGTFLEMFPNAALVDPEPRWRTPRDQRGLVSLVVDPESEQHA